MMERTSRDVYLPMTGDLLPFMVLARSHSFLGRSGEGEHASMNKTVRTAEEPG